MNKVPKNMPKDKPTTSTGVTTNPNLAKKTPVTEMNITAEITNRAISEDVRFSNRKRDGESLVYLVT
jgi:hypothetical protein